MVSGGGILIERIRIGVRSRLVQLLLGPGALECESRGTGAQSVSMWLCICLRAPVCLCRRTSKGLVRDCSESGTFITCNGDDLGV